MTKVLHVIANLGQGGAEGILFRAVAETSGRFEHTVVSLMGLGYYGERLKVLGATVITLDQTRGTLSPLAFTKLCRIIRREKPQVVQTWMYHADLVGGIAARIAGAPRIVWNVRHSMFHKRTSKLSTRLVARLCAMVSGVIPDLICCCSQRAAESHISMGYAPSKFRLIPNGVDMREYRPDAARRRTMRNEWNLGDDELIVGMIARWDAQKDHGNLLQALKIAQGKYPALKCVLVGSGVDHTNTSLIRMISRLDLTQSVLLLGARSDIPAVMNALDVHVLSSSHGEAFPNVVLEAMASATISVGTDVGDTLEIIGDADLVAPPRDALALAEVLMRALGHLESDGASPLKMVLRRRAIDCYSLDLMRERYTALWAAQEC